MSEEPVQIPKSWAQAWEATTRTGSQKRAMKELNIGAKTLRRRLRGYAAVTGAVLPLPRQRPAATLTDKHIAAWVALEVHGTYLAAADSLGIHLGTIRERLTQYRKHNDLPGDARPVPKPPRSCHRRPVVTIDQRLDVLLSQLEEAQRDGDKVKETMFRDSIHIIERRVYGCGFEPLRVQP